jgi:hypothetical protein
MRRGGALPSAGGGPPSRTGGDRLRIAGSGYQSHLVWIPNLLKMEALKRRSIFPKTSCKMPSASPRRKTKREAVVRVLEEFNRRRRMAELLKYAGTFSDQFPTNDQIEAVDALRDRRIRGRSRR